MRRTTLLMVVLVLSVFTGCARGTAAQRPVSEALMRDAEAYAEAQNVTLDEAIRRLTLQDPVGELGSVLREQESDVFAGLWIEHEPAYKVVVSVTRDQRRVHRRYVKSGPLEDDVEMREADVSWAELKAAHLRTREVLETIGSHAHTGIDTRENCVVVFADPEAIEAHVAAAGAQLPEPVCFEPSDDIAPPPPLDPPPGIAFPRRDPPEGMYTEMTALMIGELVEVSGCLRVRMGADDPGVLVVWPYDHTVTLDEDGLLAVHDGSGKTVIREGEVVRLGGGEVSASALGDFTSMEIPAACANGYYWIAASGIEPGD